MAYITNDGARLIERARTEGKFIVFGAVRMNTIFKSDPSSLVQKSDEWFGANHGQVVGCLSHVSVDDVSCVCDSKLAVQCNDNSEPWKSIGIYAHLDGEVDELLFACESIQNGEYKDVTIVELPVTLDGVVEDFGLSEGGGGGGGGGSHAPLTGAWQRYEGAGSEENPEDGDRLIFESLSVGNEEASIGIQAEEHRFNTKDGWHSAGNLQLEITAGGVTLNETYAGWSAIIKAASDESMFSQAFIYMKEGVAYLDNEQLKPNNAYKIDAYALLVIDGEGQISAVRATSGAIMDISAAVYEALTGTMHRVSGISANESDLSFESPIPLVGDQHVYVHWTRMS